jgi:hypothetical protein
MRDQHGLAARDQLCADQAGLRAPDRPRASRSGTAYRIRAGSALDQLCAGSSLGALRAGSVLDQLCAGCMRAAGWIRSARPPTLRPARRAGPARWNRRFCRSVIQPVHGSQEAAVAFLSGMHPTNGSHEPTVAFRSAIHRVHGCPRSAGRRSVSRAEPSTDRGRVPGVQPAEAAPGPESYADHA